MSNFLPPRNNTLYPLPDHIRGDMLNVSEMLDSLYEVHNQWGESDRGEASGRKLLEGAYAIARNIGDKELGDDSAEAAMLLANLRDHPNIRATTQKTDVLGAVHTHAARDNMIRTDTLVVDLSRLQNEQTPVIQQKLKERGVYVSEKEVSYFMTIRTVAHEAAHVIQGSIGRMAGVGGAEAVNFMTGPFAASHGVDVGVVNEGFAEGYAEVVLTKVLTDRGYDEATAANIMHAMSHRDNPEAVKQGYLAMDKPAVLGALESVSRAIKQKNQMGW